MTFKHILKWIPSTPVFKICSFLKQRKTKFSLTFLFLCCYHVTYKSITSVSQTSEWKLTLTLQMSVKSLQHLFKKKQVYTIYLKLHFDYFKSCRKKCFRFLNVILLLIFSLDYWVHVIFTIGSLLVTFLLRL